MTMVADTSRIRSTLDWTPQYDDLETIAAHALAWEEKLFRERRRPCAAGGNRPEIQAQALIWLEKPCFSGQGGIRSSPDARAICPAPSMERG